MKFHLSSLLLLVLSIAIPAAWWTDHTELQNEVCRLNEQATEIAAQLYTEQLQAGVIEPRTANKALFSGRPFATTPGDVVDLTTAAGRDDLLERLRNGDADFVAKISPVLTIIGPGDSFRSASAEVGSKRVPTVATQKPVLPYER